VKLRKRIVELEEELSQLRGGRGGVPTSSTQEPPHPEQGPVEDSTGGIYYYRGGYFILKSVLQAFILK